MKDLVLIWSKCREMWWRSGGRGYTSCRREAGKYSRLGAEEILKSANIIKVEEEIHEL